MNTQRKDDKARNNVIYTIMGFMLFPMMVSLLQSHNGQMGNADTEPVFDTTLIAGYTFFRTKGILLDEYSCIPLYNALYPHMGTPHRSRTGGRGLDCSGLVKKVFTEAFDINLKGSSRDFFRTTTRVEKTDLREGDLVFFTNSSNQINHVGIYLNNGKFVHTSSIRGVTINCLSEKNYKSNYHGAGRVEF